MTVPDSPKPPRLVIVAAALPPALVRRVRDEARQTDRTVSAVIRRLLREHYGEPD
jgi:hypothetical protein